MLKPINHNAKNIPEACGFSEEEYALFLRKVLKVIDNAPSMTYAIEVIEKTLKENEDQDFFLRMMTVLAIKGIDLTRQFTISDSGILRMGVDGFVKRLDQANEDLAELLGTMKVGSPEFIKKLEEDPEFLSKIDNICDRMGLTKASDLL